MKYSIESTRNAMHVSIDGPWVGDAAGWLVKDEVKERAQAGVGHVLIDMKQCNLLSSVGIGVLVSMLHSVKTAGGQLKLCSVSERVKRSLVVTGIWDSLDVYETRDDAVSAFQAAAG